MADDKKATEAAEPAKKVEIPIERVPPVAEAAQEAAHPKKAMKPKPPVKATAIHEYWYRAKGKRVIVAPGGVFECPGEEYDALIKSGAVREPTKEELALYEQAQRGPRRAASSDELL